MVETVRGVLPRGARATTVAVMTHAEDPRTAPSIRWGILAPGGIAQMGALSADVKANVPVVLSIHVLRITSVIVLMSLGLKLMGGRP